MPLLRQRFVVWGALISIGILASPIAAHGDADSAASAQRVSINLTLRQKQFPDWSGTFQLTALTAGNLSLDRGAVTSAGVGAPRDGSRDGQSFTADAGIDELRGKKGTLRLRWSQTIVSAGPLHSVATGTWRVASGTGAYAGATGRGRVAGVIGEASHVGHVRYEGFIAVP
jgi:hypothetical protein